MHIARAAAGPLQGEIRVPGDKSISHRAVLFAAMASGTSQLTGVLDSADVRSTIAAVRALGAKVAVSEEPDRSLRVEVAGWGDAGPTAPQGPLDCGNSGTTVRLLMGVLAGWPGLDVTLAGDESLSRRPMRRVSEPLARMGARFEDTDGHLPLTVHGAALTPVDYTTPVPSAQVKTAVLLAGLRASGRTSVTESAASRDHTERMLPVFGVPVERDIEGRTASVGGPVTPQAASVAVPADPSSAAFLACAAALVPASAITLRDVALNPTRTGFVAVMRRMGADIEVVPGTASYAEDAGDIRVAYAPDLQATTVTAAEVPSLIDEIPILAVLSASAHGTTRFEGVGELRVKESDRLQAIVDALTALGVHVETEGDTLAVTGPTQWRGASLDSLGDHRLAMAWTVAALALLPGTDCAVEIDRFEAIDVSYPGFLGSLDGLLG